MSITPASLTDLKAPAKLNLFLHVTGRRADGYHLLQSVFVPIDWCDTLHLHLRTDGQITRHDLTATLPPEDLCLKAARLLQQHSGTSLGADVHIDKQVPWGAGLGGGSSDAATVLKGLNTLWGLHWPTERLAELAVQLGADVPFFIHGRPAWVEGVGEQITPIELPQALFDTPVAVLKPPVAIPTPAIFGSENLRRDEKPAIVADFLAAPKQFGCNNLEEPAKAYSQEVVQALEWMQARFGNSRMTGSGSAVFAWVDTLSHQRQPFTPADVGVSDLTQTGPWVGRMCRLIRQA
ncbi:4-(cytidine 5'-diphospho)-2-C-methyl-D-erythritol kinase [Aquabacterium lacunae]|uniref:4-(cytidine 5'-diphospho)-2-C-methyl-D-erythritol kinase n=1 Tax=Aquabacterium lacunae TaxID=2528630 RepID=UPI001FE04C44|nr:4-(cytidine 5'-diphospho)-2-C-methyl-D-erythritol kinase [Aquabacterium lacunae]